MAGDNHPNGNGVAADVQEAVDQFSTDAGDLAREIREKADEARKTMVRTLNDSALVFARVRNGTTWSASTEALFENSVVPKIRVSEIMYHPADAPGNTPVDDQFEFIEVQNVSAAPLNLAAAKFNLGLDFTFGNVTLNPGAYAVVVRNRAAFEARYGVGTATMIMSASPSSAGSSV